MAYPARKPWTAEDSAIVQHGIDCGLSSRSIGKLLPARSRSSIASHMRALSPGAPPVDARSTPNDSKDANMRGDTKFQTAMLAAIKSGKERATVGTVKDNRPINPSRFMPGATISGCGSSASMCVDAAGSRSLRWSTGIGGA